LHAAALRGACPSRQIRSGDAERKSGTGFLAADMKEYDA
jgi:hypothetical protein